jgi:hypothetical protein
VIRRIEVAASGSTRLASLRAAGADLKAATSLFVNAGRAENNRMKTSKPEAIFETHLGHGTLGQPGRRSDTFTNLSVRAKANGHHGSPQPV